MLHIHLDLFHDRLRCLLHDRLKVCQSSVFVVGRLIKHRHIDPRDLCSTLQKCHSVLSGLFPFLVFIHHATVLRLPLADVKHVKEIGDRLRIVAARTSTDHKRILHRPFLCLKWDPGKIKNLQNIGITHLILQRDPEKIKIPDRLLRFQCKQRNMLLTHDLIQIHPRRIHSLAIYVIPLIEHIVKDLYAKMGHTDLIYIRKTHTETHIHLCRILFDHVDLISNISRRFFHR